MTTVDEVRLYISDRATDAQGNTIKPLFTNVQVQDFIDKAGDDLYLATLEGWRVKMSIYADEYNVAADGSSLSRSDLWKHAKEMVEYWQLHASVDGASGMTNIKLTTDSAPASEGDDLVG